MTQAFSNADLKTELCNNCDCTGLVPVVTFVYDPADPDITFTDDSDFPAGDGFNVINITVTDKDGNRVQGQITAAAGTFVAQVDEFNLGDGLDIIATVVSDEGCTAEMSLYNLAQGTLEGSLNA